MRLQVLDKRRLARVCRQVERWEGSWRKAAQQLGLGAGTFWRLRAAQGGKAINGGIFQALYGYLPPEHVSDVSISRWQQDLFRAVLSPQAAEAFNTYWQWLRRELRRSGKRWHARDDWPSPAGDGRYSACVRVVDALRRKYPKDFAPLDNLMGTPTQVRALTAGGENVVPWVTRTARGEQRTDGWRFHLADIRIAEPLAASEESGGVELGLEELTRAPEGAAAKRGKKRAPDPLRDYVRAAVKRELILLNRRADIERAQEAAQRRPPSR